MKPRPGWRQQRREGHDPDADIRAELELHLAGRVEEYVESGMNEIEARRAALARFGDVQRIANRCRREAGTSRMALLKKGNEFMHSVRQDIRYAVRTLIRRPGYASAILATLLLAIGATTAVFSVVNGVLLHPLPHPDPEELVLVHEVDQRPGFIEDHNSVTAANYRDWTELNRVFSTMAAYQAFPITFRGLEDPERVLAGIVSADFFRTLGVNAAIGRTFLPEEDLPGNDNVAMLSYAFWQSRFGADSSVIGQSIGLGSGTFPIVGVLPARFEFLDRDFAVWVPLGLTEQALQNRRTHNLRVIARLEPGLTVQAAQRDMDRVVDALRAEYPQFLTGWGVNVVSITDEVVGRIRPALLVLMSAVGFVLLIASVNVANLMLARTAAEQREMAIRTALGAGSGRLIRHKLTESLVLGLAGGALGVLAANGATRLLLAVAPDNLPQVDQIGIDGRVLAFALAVSLVTGVLFGTAPGLQASRTNVANGLKDGSRGATVSRGHQRLRAGFVVTQVAFSLVLLVSAGLMMTTFARLMRVDPGFEPESVATMKVALRRAEYPTKAEQVALYDRMLPALARLPETQQVALTRLLPLADDEWTWGVQVVGQSPQQEGEKRDYGWHAVSPGYFETMGITLIRGRSFNEFDRADAPRVVIVNEALVRRFFPNDEDPVGQRMFVMSRPDEIMEIVGVIEDVHHYSLDIDPVPAYHVPYRQIPFDYFLSEMNLILQTGGDPTAAVSGARRVIREIDPAIVVSDVLTMAERISRSVARTRFAMILLGVFAGVALALAVVGIYGVISYAVGQRAQEIGVRIALGAEPVRIVGQFVSAGLKLVGAGLAVGLAGAVVFTRFQASLLYGVEAVDPMTYGAVSGLLGLVALAAIYLPARRASRVDPMAVLRNE
jgi:putative ABC transport system permease protein